jgi:hypothetical protein
MVRHPAFWRRFAPLLLVLGMALLWSGYWYATLGRAKTGFSRFEADLTARGGALSCNGERWGGFPFRISLTCGRLALRLSQEGPSFETEDVEALAKAYALRDVVATARGPSRLSFAGRPAFVIDHAPLSASFRLEADGQAQAQLSVTDTALSLTHGAVLARGKGLRLTAENKGQQTVDFEVASDGLTVAPAAGTELTVDSLRIRGSIDNLPPGFAAFPGDLLTAAAVSGARMSIESLHVVVAQSTISGSGSVTLGIDGYPEGKIAMRVGDLRRFLAGLEDRGIAVNAGAFMLGLLLGRNQEASIALIFRQGSVYWGPFKLFEHGPIR